MWFYEENGQSVGPVEEAELKGKLNAGTLPARTMVWREGLGDWQQARTVFPGLSAARGQTTNPYNPPCGSSAPAGSHHPNVAAAPGIAVTSMVLGICSVLLGLTTCVLGIVCGIPAVICGHIAMKRIKTEHLPGHGMALAGLITGYISIVGTILGILFLVLMLFIPGVDPSQRLP